MQNLGREEGELAKLEQQFNESDVVKRDMIDCLEYRSQKNVHTSLLKELQNLEQQIAQVVLDAPQNELSCIFGVVRWEEADFTRNEKRAQEVDNRCFFSLAF